MKTMIFAAALLCGSAALAQDAYKPDAMAMPATEQTVAPGNTAPELDARGIPVISDPATAPAGFNQPAGSNGVGGPMVDASQPPAPQPATENYPACTRAVTDNCVQTYERGSRRPR